MEPGSLRKNLDGISIPGSSKRVLQKGPDIGEKRNLVGLNQYFRRAQGPFQSPLIQRECNRGYSKSIFVNKASNSYWFCRQTPSNSVVLRGTIKEVDQPI